MVILTVLAVSVVIILIEVPALWRTRMIRELWAFSILLFFGAGLSIANGLHIKIPNPLDGMIIVYKPFSEFLFRFLQ